MLVCIREKLATTSYQNRSADDCNPVVRRHPAELIVLTHPKQLIRMLLFFRAAGDFLAQRAHCLGRKRKLKYNYRRTAFTAAYGGGLMGKLFLAAPDIFELWCTEGKVQPQDLSDTSGIGNLTKWPQAACVLQQLPLLLPR